MTRTWFTLVCLLVAAAPAWSAIERTVERTFSVNPGGRLKIDTFHGPVRVDSADDNQIHIVIHQTIDAENGAAADRRVAELELGFVQMGDSLTVTTRHRRYLRWAWENWPPVALAMEVKVPRACSVDLSSRDGSITVGRITGSVRARTLNGAIFVGEVDGTVDASSPRGDVAVTACTGELTLSAEAGNVLVGRAGGLTRIDGRDGSIEVQNARGRVRINGDNSDVKVTFVHPITHDSEVRSSGGDVTLHFDSRSACTVTARASPFGEIKVKHLSVSVVSGDIDGSRLVGKLNGGGPAVLAIASGGDVRLSGDVP